MSANNTIKTIMWDYDGTLVDSRIKNLNVTRKIIEKATGKNYIEFPALRNLPDFENAHQQSENWRDFYYREFNFTEEQTNHIGAWWTEFQLQDDTTVKLFPGIFEVLSSLKYYHHAIVSQNSRENILNTLKSEMIDDIINCIVGFEEVKINRQKPYPDGLLKCLDQLNSKNKELVIYIGDHEGDAQLVHNVNTYLHSNHSDLEVISIGAFYIFPTDTSNWKYKPDFEAKTTNDILTILNRLA